MSRYYAYGLVVEFSVGVRTRDMGLHTITGAANLAPPIVFTEVDSVNRWQRTCILTMIFREGKLKVAAMMRRGNRRRKKTWFDTCQRDS